MTVYQSLISEMDDTELARVKPDWWGRTYGVDPGVISEAVNQRWKELLKDRPEAGGD